EARGVEDRVLRAEEGADLRLELLVQVLRTADEPHRAHPEAASVDRLVRRLDHARVGGEAEVVVCAEIEHVPPVRTGTDADPRRLRRDDDTLVLVQARIADLAERRLVGLPCTSEHECLVVERRPRRDRAACPNARRWINGPPSAHAAQLTY